MRESLYFVPKGLSTIARCFNAGFSAPPTPLVPKGRLNRSRGEAQPSLWDYRINNDRDPGVETPGYSRKVPSGLCAFTLLELLIAVSIFAIVLGAINAVFYSALRLRNRSAAMMDKAVPIEHAISIIKRDLANLVPPGSMLAGPLQSTPTSSNTMAGATGPIFYCSDGVVDEASPWAEIQKVSYALAESTNRFQGKDLVRLIDRNLLAAAPEGPWRQLLLSGVQGIAFAFYDGSQWRDYWDSTTEDPKLPRGIRVRIQRAPDADNPNAPLPPILELIVPVIVTPSTNTTTQGSAGQ
jgi:type II secretion system protein J